MTKLAASFKVNELEMLLFLIRYYFVSRLLLVCTTYLQSKISKYYRVLWCGTVTGTWLYFITD